MGQQLLVLCPQGTHKPWVSASPCAQGDRHGACLAQYKCAGSQRKSHRRSYQVTDLWENNPNPSTENISPPRAQLCDWGEWGGTRKSIVSVQCRLWCNKILLWLKSLLDTRALHPRGFQHSPAYSGPWWTPEHSGPKDPSSPQPAPHHCQRKKVAAEGCGGLLRPKGR